jgi:hypothetical protein
LLSNLLALGLFIGEVGCLLPTRDVLFRGSQRQLQRGYKAI